VAGERNCARIWRCGIVSRREGYLWLALLSLHYFVRKQWLAIWLWLKRSPLAMPAISANAAGESGGV